jgi:PPOX class probable F420-dependent enzyme
MLLTTFKPDGIPVSATVHGVVHDGRAYFRAWSRSGTVQNLRHTDEVQVAPYSLGLRLAPPLDAIARLLPGEEASRVAGQLARKYPVQQRFLIPLLHRARRSQMVYYELVTYEAAAAMTNDRAAS